MSGQLSVVPTPIGNLEDITLRAIRTLREADLIIAEDTRTSGFLLKHLEISRPLRSYHQHNEHKILEDIIRQLKEGRNIALISDAGTPGISDPGFLLIREAIANDITVSCLPGPTAFVPALVASGFPCDTFSFFGFMPQKKGRQTQLKMLAEEPRTFILYESPFRLLKLLSELREYLGEERRIAVCRELSKKFEEVRRGTAAALSEHFSQHPPKGEIVVIAEGKHE